MSAERRRIGRAVRGLSVALLLALLVVLPALEARGQLDQDYCRDYLNGTWTPGTYTCTIPSGTTGAVPAGDTLILQELYDIVVSAGATLNVNGTIWMQPGNIYNSGALNIVAGGEIVVYGRIDGWGNAGRIDNSGTFTNEGTLTVYGSTLTVPPTGGVVENSGTITNNGISITTPTTSTTAAA